jgi:hypothetical protein
MRGRTTAIAGVVALIAARCSLPSARADAPYRDVLIENVPHVQQRPDFCGEACAEMFLRKLGSDITQDRVFDQSGVDPLLGRGCYTAELKTALERIGFKVGDVWYKVRAADAAHAAVGAAADARVAGADSELEQQFRALHADLLRGVPSILCMHYSDDRRADLPRTGRGERRVPPDAAAAASQALAAPV